MRSTLFIRILKQLQLHLSVIFLITMAGCAGLKNDLQYHKPVVVDPVYIRETNGIRLSIDPIFDEARAKEIFDYSPKMLEIFPIYVSIENNANVSMLIRKQHFHLLAGTAKSVHADKNALTCQPDIDGKIGDLHVSPGKRAASIVVGLIFGSGGINEYSSEINHNFTREELRDTTIQPGQRAEGCVYFRVPNGTMSDRYLLDVTIIELGTQKRYQIDFDIADVTRR